MASSGFYQHPSQLCLKSQYCWVSGKFSTFCGESNMQQFILAYLASLCELLKSRDCLCLCVSRWIWPLKLWCWVGRIYRSCCNKNNSTKSPSIDTWTEPRSPILKYYYCFQQLLSSVTGIFHLARTLQIRWSMEPTWRDLHGASSGVLYGIPKTQPKREWAQLSYYYACLDENGRTVRGVLIFSGADHLWQNLFCQA